MSRTRTERLLNLLNVVVEADRPVTAAEIRRRVPGYPPAEPSFQRQFERDKQELREMGLPMDPVPDPNPERPPGYRIRRDDAFLRDPGLEPDELAALHLAAETVRLEGMEGRAALWKLGGRPGARDLAEGAEPGPPGVAGLPADDRLGALFAAVAERRRVTFRYRGEEREVDPYRLQLTRGRWYLTGFDHARGEPRHFRLGRVDGRVRASDPGAFDRPPQRPEPLTMDAWMYGSTPPVTARVLVDGDHAAEVRQAAPRARVVEQRDDGGLVVELEVVDREAFRSLVLGLLEHAEVLEPEPLRRDVVAWLEAIAG